MTLNEFCKGKTIKDVEVEFRGAYEGCFIGIVFEDGTRIWITEMANVFDKDGNRTEVDT